ncbi:prosaposin isoform X3 [Lepeophtheirus salmonis]|uniref:prosaposin isoform X3 n=1 Tax=Lepeophtheirus salmonis TaxID=72036 RepID=UPI001AE15EA8|nr:prosaposin-like isoform X4 [Lepeophtheirus salmonis]
MRTTSLPFLLLVITLSGSVWAGQLGAPKCTWGPTYWCSDFSTARECFATTHCIQNVWSKLELPPDDDEVCAVCKEMVAEARDTLRSNETREELKEVFEGSCKLIPIKAIANECIKIFDDFVPELVETLASEMNPQIVCATAGLCNSKRIDNLLKNLYAQSTTNMCNTCRSGVQKFTQRIQDSDPRSLKLRFMDLCDELSSFSDACKVTVEDSFDDIHNVLKFNLNDEICDLMGVCSETFETPVVDSSNSEDIECEFCEKVIQHWKDEWTSRTTIEEFKEVLDALCNKLHNTDRINRCLHIVNDYYIPIFNFVSHELDPKVICEIFGLCNMNLDSMFQIREDSSIFTLLMPEGSDNSIVVPKVPLVDAQQSIDSIPMFRANMLEDEDYPYISLQNAERVIQQTPLISLFPASGESQPKVQIIEASSIVENADGTPLVELDSTMVFQVPTSEAQESNDITVSQDEEVLECQLCKDVIIALKSKVNNNTEEEIKEKLEKMCLAFPAIVRDQCKTLVDKYTDEIINGIIRDLSPQEICEQLELCKPSIIIVKKDHSSDNTAGCALCEYIIGQLDTYLNKKGNRDSIENALESICDMMSSQSSKKKCDEFVDSYINAIIDTFTHGMSPKELCQLIYICQSNNVRRNELSLGPQNQCKICDGIFTEIYEDVLDKEEEIKEALRNVCDAVLSGSDVESCKIMVDTYVSMVISNIMQYDSPDEFCRNFYQCEEDSSEELIPLYHPNEIPPLEMVLSHEYSMASFCVDCIKVINELENSAFTNTSIDFTVRTLQMVCSTFPSPIDTRCEDAIDEIDGDIEGFFSNNPPKSVCKYLRVCPSSLYDQSLKLWDAGIVGGNKCIWGPEYWCQSLVHARTCGTLDHCRNNVWL